MRPIQLIFGQLSKNQLLFKTLTNSTYKQNQITSKYLTSTQKQQENVDFKTPIEQKQAEISEQKVNQTLKLLSSGSTTFVDSLPSAIQPYLRLMRIDKPIGTYVVFWPGAWSILATASYLQATMPDFKMLGIFALGALSMRSVGCIVNDIWDRKIDIKVERTKTRPLASGEIGLPSALVLLGANLGLSLYLLLQLNLVTQILGACALFPTIVYPAAKRYSNWPQLYLGLAINWGALMGWTSVLCNDISNISSIFSLFPGLALYTSCISWTIFYDTIYAHQDKEHDKKLGLKSTTFTFGNRQKTWLLAFSTLTTSNLCLFGYLTDQQPIFYACMGLVYAHFLKQILFVNLNSPESCQKNFKSNNTIGVIVSLGLLLSIFAR
jgi:4-hydroxybenzoate polyprenyltransferase